MKDACKVMLKIPLPIFGVRGIRYLAERTIKSGEKMGFVEACRQLANIVRMQEEVGTGGAGFRYMYAAFLAGSRRTVRICRAWLTCQRK